MYWEPKKVSSSEVGIELLLLISILLFSLLILRICQVPIWDLNVSILSIHIALWNVGRFILDIIFEAEQAGIKKKFLKVLYTL